MIHIDFDDLARPSCSRDPIHRNHVVSFLVPRYIITSGLVSTVIVRRGALGSNCRHLTTPPHSSGSNLAKSSSAQKSYSSTCLIVTSIELTQCSQQICGCRSTITSVGLLWGEEVRQGVREDEEGEEEGQEGESDFTC